MEILKVKGVTKRFGNFTANDHVDFACNKGSVVALLGENGAGKSTLMKMIYGMYKPDEGDIYFEGKKVVMQSPKDASRLGIQMVHQHFMLVDSLTVAENVVLGKEPQKYGIYHKKQAEDVVRELARNYGLHVEPAQKISELSVGAKQRTEIIKALYQGAKLLILDEPTAVLTPQEADDLFKIIDKLRSDGKCIIIITHKLRETMAIADDVYVLRHGKMVGKVKKTDTDPSELTRLMVGHELKAFEKAETSFGETVLEISDLKIRNQDGTLALNNLNLKIRGGEIYGIAGVEGNGQRELVEAIAGITKGWEGTVKVHDRHINHLSVRDVIDLGVATIHSDRHERGLLLDLNAEQNILLGYQHRKEMKNRYRLLNMRRISEISKVIFEKYDVRPNNIKNTARSFSGGNQQKYIVGREFRREPRLALVAYPTRGVDIAAADIIHDNIVRLRAQGAAVLLITSDFDELFKLSDSIGVIYEGKIVTSGPAGKYDPNLLGYYMGGGE